jgi:hypothetical protein
MLTSRAQPWPDVGYGYGVYLLPGGQFGHDGGEPGVTAVVQRVPSADVSAVVLCNAEVQEMELRDLLLAAATG